jgi:hypothetical protein
MLIQLGIQSEETIEAKLPATSPPSASLAHLAVEESAPADNMMDVDVASAPARSETKSSRPDEGQSEEDDTEEDDCTMNVDVVASSSKA